MKKMCFGTLLLLIYQSKGPSVTYKIICDKVFKAYGTPGMENRDSSLPSHLTSGHNNVPPEVVEAARTSSFHDAVLAFKPVAELISNEKGFVYAVKAVLQEDSIPGDTLIGYVKGFEKQSILDSQKFSMTPLLASLFRYAIVDVVNSDCADNLKDFGKNYLSSVDTSSPLFIDPFSEEDFHNSDELSPLKKTMTDEYFSRAFRKVSSEIVSGLTHPSTAAIYSVDLNNCKLRFRDVKEFILRNIASYVFSRGNVDELQKEGTPVGTIGSKAMTRFIKAYGENSSSVLGELLLYAFLEHELNAPKIMSKIEFSRETGVASKSDGIHLLTTSEYGRPFNQLVFGASDVTGSLKEAVDRAFDRVVAIEKNSDSEYLTVEYLSRTRRFDKPTQDYLMDVLVPRKNYIPKPDMAFGLFLGYTLVLEHNETDSYRYRIAAEEQLKKDINSICPYIAHKMSVLRLEGYSFYCYVLPFNDAPVEKTSIIDEMLVGEF